MIGDDNFSIKLHHGGHFRNGKRRVYVGGKVDVVDHYDSERIFVQELEKMIKELGRSGTFFYYCLIPGEEMNSGLRQLKGHSDIVSFCKDVNTYKVMEV